MMKKINSKYIFIAIITLITACDLNFPCIGSANYGNVSSFNIKIPSNPITLNEEGTETFVELEQTQGLNAKYQSEDLDCGEDGIISKDTNIYNWVNTGITFTDPDDKIIITVNGAANFCTATSLDESLEVGCTQSITKISAHPMSVKEAKIFGFQDPLISEHWQPKIIKSTDSNIEPSCRPNLASPSGVYKLNRAKDLVFKIDIPKIEYYTKDDLTKEAIFNYNSLEQEFKDAIESKETYINLSKLLSARENSYALGSNDASQLRDNALKISGACDVRRIRDENTFEPADDYKIGDIGKLDLIKTLTSWSTSESFDVEIGLFDNKYYALEIPGLSTDEGSSFPTSTMSLKDQDKFIKNPVTKDELALIHGMENIESSDFEVKNCEYEEAYNFDAINIDEQVGLLVLDPEKLKEVELGLENDTKADRKYLEFKGERAQKVKTQNFNYCKQDVYFYKGSEELTGYLRYKLKNIKLLSQGEGGTFCCRDPDSDGENTKVYGIDFTNLDYDDSDRYISPLYDDNDETRDHRCSCKCSDKFGTRDGCDILWQTPKYGDGCYKTSKVGGSQSCGALASGCETGVLQWRNIRWRGDVQYFSENFDNFGFVNINAGASYSCTLGHEAMEFRIGESNERDSIKTLTQKEYRGATWNNYQGTLYARVIDQEILLKKDELGIDNGECHWQKEGKLGDLKTLYNDNSGEYSLSVTIIKDYSDDITQVKNILFDKFDEIFSLDFRKAYFQNLVGRTVVEITDEVNSFYNAIRNTEKSGADAEFERKRLELEKIYNQGTFNYDSLSEEQKADYNSKIAQYNQEKTDSQNRIDTEIDQEIQIEIDDRLENNTPTLQKLIRVVMTLYIVFTAIGFLLGSVQINQTELLFKILKIGFVYTLLSPGSWEYFYMFMDIFENGAADLSMTITKTFLEIGDDSSVQPIDAIYSRIDELIYIFFQPEVHYKISAILFTPFIVGIVLIIMVYYAFFLVLYAIAKSIFIYLFIKIILTMLFMVGPIFIIFILFQRTKGMFDAWLNMLISYSFQIIFLFITIAFFSALVYDIFFQLFFYPVCWDKVLSIKIGHFREFNLIYFWKFQMADPRYGDIYNASLGPDFTSILFFLTIGFIFKQMIDKVTDLGDKIAGEGGIGAGSLAQNMMQDGFKAAGEAFGFVRKNIAQPIAGRAVYAAGKLGYSVTRGAISGVKTGASLAVNKLDPSLKDVTESDSRLRKNLKNMFKDPSEGIKESKDQAIKSLKNFARNPVESIKTGFRALDRADESYRRAADIKGNFKSLIGANKMDFSGNIKNKSFASQIIDTKKNTINQAMSEIRSKGVTGKEASNLIEKRLRENLTNLGVSDNQLDKDMASKAFEKIKSKEKYRGIDFSRLLAEDPDDFRKDLNKELSRKMKALGYKQDFYFDDIKDINLDKDDLDKAYNEKIKNTVQGRINAKVNPIAINPFESDLDRAVNAERKNIRRKVNSLDYSESDLINSNEKIQKLKYDFNDKVKKHEKLAKDLDKKFKEEAEYEPSKERQDKFNNENRKLIEELKLVRDNIDSLGEKIKDETAVNAKLKIASKYHRDDIRTKYDESKFKAQRLANKGKKKIDEKIDDMIDKKIDNTNIAPVTNDRDISFMADLERGKDEYDDKRNNIKEREEKFDEYYQVLNEMLDKDSADAALELDNANPNPNPNPNRLQAIQEESQEESQDDILREELKSEIYEAKNMDDLYEIYDGYVDYRAKKEVEKEESIQDELLEEINYNKYEELFEENEYDRPAIETDDLEIDDDPYDPDVSDDFINDDKKTKQDTKSSMKKESKEQFSQRARNLTSQISEKEADLAKLQKELESNNNQSTRIKIIRLRNEIATLRARLSQETSKNS